VKQANNIIPALRDDENTLEAMAIEDPFFSLKTTLFSFFQNMLTKVQAEDDFTKKVKDALLEKIELGEITVAQLMVLLNSLNADKQGLVDSILGIFKPAPGTGEVSPLIAPKTASGSADGAPDAFADLSVKDREVLDKLSRIMDEVGDEQSTKS
jgi:hypothetical protein